MMRVSSGMMINHYMNQINASYANQAKLMEQSDGSNLHRASDDSVRYSRYLTYQNRNTENLQYQDNVKAGSSWMKTADAAMVNMTDIYTTLKEKTVDAANDTNNDNDLITAISKEFKAKLYEMVSLGNNQLGDRYLFAGQSDLTQPFQISTEEKDRGLIKTLDDPQSRFFSNPDDTKNLNVDDTGNLKQFLEVNDTEGNRYFVNTQNGKIYTEDFIMEGYKDKLKEGIEYVQEGDEYATLPFFDTEALNVAGYFENTGVKRVEGEVTIKNSDGTVADPATYSYGQQLWLKDGETATATVPVYVVDEYGNTRVIAKGNKIEINDGVGEEAFIGVPLSATKYQSGKILSLSSTSVDPEVEPVKKFNAGDTYTLETYEYAIADADVQYYIGNSTVPLTAKAGEVIPAAGYDDYDGVYDTEKAGKIDYVRIEFLTDNTSILRDPKRVNNDTDTPQTIGYVKSLTAKLDGDLANASIKSDEVLTIKRTSEESNLSASDIKNLLLSSSDYLDDKSVFADKTITVKLDNGDGTFSYDVVNANTDLKEHLQADNFVDLKIGNFTTDDGFEDGDTIPATTTNLTIHTYTAIDTSEELNGYLKEYSDAADPTKVDLRIGSYNNEADFISADAEAKTANISIYYHNTLTTKEMNTGSPVIFEDTEGNPVNTVTLPSADVMIQDAKGNARMVKAGNPITLNKDAGETEAIIIGKPMSSYFYSGFTTIKQPIVTYQGDPKYISMVKLNGTVDQMADTVNVTGQDLNGSNIFDDANSGNQTQLMSNGKLCYASSGTAMINDMFTVCAKLEHGDRKWMRTDGITVADMAHEVITTTQSKAAARQNVYDSVEQMLTKQNETITNDINDVSATDVAELAVKMMQAQTIYNMALSVGSRIIPPTLADYL